MQTKLSRNTRRAIAAYGEDACKRAYVMHLAGNGARTVALEGPTSIRTTQQADAAINAGRELCNLPVVQS